MLAPIEVAAIFQAEVASSPTRTWEAMVRDGHQIYTLTVTGTVHPERLTSGKCDCGWELSKPSCVHFTAIQAVDIISTSEPVRN